MSSILQAASIIALIAVCATAHSAETAFVKPGRRIFVDNVWAGCSAGYAMATRDGKQYIAYYDSERWMTVACRDLDSETWRKQRLDNQIGWDSHNYIAMAFDADGHLHVSGNMHCVPLKYFRTSVPGDISTLAPIHRMTGELEQRVTYPRFYGGPKGEFLFTYRDGASGNGSNIINAYDVKTKTWSRYISKPILDGQGLMNAYQAGPARDRKGDYHLVWVWRDTPACETNHDVSYARSRGSLTDWQKTDGTPIPLPITLDTGDILDPVQIKEGLLNSVKISFDSDDRPLVSYIKYDPRGRTQIYTMRLEDGRWRRYQTTNWPDRWEFSGNGTINGMINFGGPVPWNDNGVLYQTYTNRFQAPHAQVRFLDGKKLQPIGDPLRIFPAEIETPSPERKGDWRVHLMGASLESIKKSGSTWAFRWETFAPNRDKAQAEEPAPSRLELVELVVADQSALDALLALKGQ